MDWTPKAMSASMSESDPSMPTTCLELAHIRGNGSHCQSDDGMQSSVGLSARHSINYYQSDANDVAIDSMSAKTSLTIRD